ncbi:MAG: undecaprenyldiphospho-muramoylpentapeptide beta-N-acetylglucosaminyltransferase [Gemmatimonadales bacterium]|nr:MAG: undecaprenyldiphospho-muramoylpentapeptide beta-N-acetylglucosaminyltransferase [Gemmatimonadales bacterium]
MTPVKTVRRAGAGPGPTPAPAVVVFSGGGTGGHLYPALALADAMEKVVPGLRTFFVGARRGLEARILPRRGREHLLLPVEGFKRDRLLANIRVVANLAISFLAVLRAFLSRRPGLVVVTGGYAGGPAGLAAALLRIPLALQEQNAVPGVTTRWLARVAREIHVAFPEASHHLPAGARDRVRVSGNPIEPPAPVDRREAIPHFGLDPSLPVVLVVGGSQGSLALNRGLLAAVGAAQSQAPEAPGFQILWSTGPTHLEEVQARLTEVGSPDWVRPVAYIDEMPRALGIASLAVSRAGAMATSEFLAWGIPSILVPLPTAAADHQRKNAAALEEAGAAVLVPEDELDGPDLLRRLLALMTDPERLDGMARCARDRGRPHAARDIAHALARLLPPASPRTGEATPRARDPHRTGDPPATPEAS